MNKFSLIAVCLLIPTLSFAAKSDRRPAAQKQSSFSCSNVTPDHGYSITLHAHNVASLTEETIAGPQVIGGKWTCTVTSTVKNVPDAATQTDCTSKTLDGASIMVISGGLFGHVSATINLPGKEEVFIPSCNSD